MSSSSTNMTGKHVNNKITSQSCRFRVVSSRIKANNCIYFPVFNNGDHFWHINCIPVEGDVKGFIDHLSFDLHYGGEWKDVSVTFDIGLLTKDESPSLAKWKTTRHVFATCAKPFRLDNVAEGDEVMRYLENDYFIVICNVTILSATFMVTPDSGVTILGALTGTYKKYPFEISSLNQNRALIKPNRMIKEDMASGSFHFNVGWSDMMADDGEYMQFPVFTVGEHCWLIKCFYQKGSYLSFFLCALSEIKDVNVSLEFGMLKKDQGPSSIKWRTMTHTFKNRGDCISMNKFIESGDLKQYLKDEYFKIICNLIILSETITSDRDVTLLGSTILPNVHSGNNGSSPRLHEHLGKLLQNKERTDVVFDVNGGIFHAHKLVLAARSSVFNEELFGPANENNTNKIKITKIEPDIFMAMLHFIYTDMLPDSKESICDGNEETNQLFSTKMFQQLLVAADLYALERLKQICEDKLLKSFTVDTVATTLLLAERHNCPKLKAKCLEFATSPQHFIKIAVTDGYRNLVLSSPTILDELREMQ